MRITVRGFNQNRLGFTLDDVPLGDMSYGNANGLHISRAISSENVNRAFLSQGTGALETASSSNLGGTLQFYSSDPLKKFGLQAAQTLGSDSNRRSFVRVDSGETGFGAFYASYTHQNADKWKGQGEQRLEQWNLKYVKEFFGDSKLSAFVNTSKRREVDYQDMSLEMIGRLGKDWDNFYPDFGAALNAAATLCGNNGTTYTPRCDDAYYAGAGLRDDQLAGITLDARLSQQARLKTTAYYHHNKGMGLWFTPYPPAPTAPLVSVRTTEYGIHRAGVLSNLEYELGAHLIKVGVWFENNDFDQARRFYGASATAVPSVYDYPSNPYFTQWQYAFNTKTTQFSLSDTVALAKDLTLGFGFKALRAKIDGDLQVGTGLPSGSISASKGFLPQIGVNYQLSGSDELFAGAARNMRVFQAAGTGGPFSTTAAGFNAIKGSLKPETSDSFEAGWRSQTRSYQGSLTAYLVNFRDRQLAVQQGAGIQGNPSVLSNVGGVRSVGLEAALSLRLAAGVTWYHSLSQSRSTYQDNVVSNGVTVATSGKHVVDAPDTMYKTSLGYDNGLLFGAIGADYMSKRYYSYLNDAAVPNRTLLNLSGGLRSKNLGFISEGTLQFGVSNLSNKSYVSTVGSNGFTNSDATGTGQTLLVGAPRQFFVTLSGKL
ncbi:MAG: TonB-dependent receptor [Burkholderiaceae bacterium]